MKGLTKNVREFSNFLSEEVKNAKPYTTEMAILLNIQQEFKRLHLDEV